MYVTDHQPVVEGALLSTDFQPVQKSHKFVSIDFQLFISRPW